MWMVFVAVPFSDFPIFHIFLSFRYFESIENIKGDENIRLSIEYIDIIHSLSMASQGAWSMKHVEIK